MYKDIRTAALGVIGLLTAAVLGLSGCANLNKDIEKSNPVSETVETPQETAEPTETSKKTSEPVAEAELSLETLETVLTESNSWESEGRFFKQYDISMTNHTSEDMKSAEVVITVPEKTQIEQFWNITPTLNGEELSIVPADYYYPIKAGDTIIDMGMIVSNDEDVKIEGSVIAEKADNEVPVKKEVITDADSEEVKRPDEISPLHVDGAYLYNDKNERVQLRGVSTHGLAWFPEYVNYDTFKTIRDDWGVNLIRLAMYTEEYGGYCNGGDREKLMSLVDNGVEYATELGMYAIIDWHILSDGDPLINKDEAVKFFDTQSKKYASYDNVIYEICNEPNGTSWDGNIKPYAKEIISVIRANSPDALIIVGTNTWCQDIMDAANSPIDEENILYSVHFYAATNGDDCRKRVKDALDRGVPVFISECSICNADGSQEVDYNSADMWMKLINKYGIGYVYWNLSNKNETSALLAPECKKLKDFEESDLSVTGKYFLTYK